MPAARTRAELERLKAELEGAAPAEPPPAKAAPRRKAPSAAAATPDPTTAEAAPAADAAGEAAPVEEPEEAPGVTGEDLQRLVKELQDTVAEIGGTAGSLVTAHPLAAVASAFLLGVMVGRTWGRS